jgi:hypothetical protein
MIDSILNHAHTCFISNLYTYLPKHNFGISQCLIEEWMGKEVEVVNMVMPVIGWKKVDFAGDIFWFDPDTYEKFRQKIEEYLIREL